MIRALAQILATAIIWTATMVIFVQGIFAVNYQDRSALQFGAFSVAVVALGATISTACVWRVPRNDQTPISTSAKSIAEDEWARV